ncbi:MAG: hypothetical protein LBT09_03045 [Planctomycetaceae bacterium]|jgi:hypothetical protein|nr:hypothetical protein [Planctomycetaceae bacterium]
MGTKAIEIDIPTALPSELASVFPKDVSEELIRDAVDSASDIFFGKLTSALPSSSEIRVASDAVKNKLLEVIESNHWIELLCGESATSDQRGYLRLHLRKLILPPEIPDLLHTQAEVRPVVLTAVTAVMTAVGLFIGGGVSKLVGLSGETGFVLGSVLGAVVGVFCVMFLASRERLRNRFLLGLGLVAGCDVAVFLLRNMSLITRGSVLSILKRFGFYGGLMLIAIVSKREKVFNRENYRREVEAIIRQWLNSVLSVYAVLTYKINSLELNPFNRYAEDRDKLNSVVLIVRKLKKAGSNDASIIISELIQELESCGFDLGEECGEVSVGNDNAVLLPDKIFNWDESQNKFYNPIGIIRNGDNFEVIEEPVIRNEIVERKGTVRKKR